jgi:hypothetical protein
MHSPHIARKRRRHAEEDAAIDPNCCCDVCRAVLVDPVTLPCTHTHDRHCLLRLFTLARHLGQPFACPTCADATVLSLPGVNVQMRSMVQQCYPEQVSDVGRVTCPLAPRGEKEIR